MLRSFAGGRRRAFAVLGSVSMLVVLALAVASPPVVVGQATRTWVSGVGDDANPCSRTAPCKTFAGAISKTANHGEINCLDSGGFGVLTITKSISVVCNGVIGGVLASGTSGFIVNVGATDVVQLSGLDIEGAGAGLAGVRMIGLGTLYIRATSIRDFTQHGVELQGGAGARVYLQDSQVYNNAGGGFLQNGSGGVNNSSVIERTSFESNGSTSIKIVGPGSMILSGDSLTASATALDITNSPTVISYSNNVIRGSGSPTNTIALQ